MPGQGAFTPMYPTVQNVFNSARYYAETGQRADDVPGTSGRSGVGQRALVGMFVVVLAIWAIERHRLGVGFRFGVNS